MLPHRLQGQGSGLLLLVISLIFSNGYPQRVSAGQINFDDVANGTIIDTHYPGVTFGCVACGSGHAFARDMNAVGSTTAATDPNVITLVDPNASSLTSFNAASGAVTVFFTTPQRTVTIQARPQLPLEYLGAGVNKPFLEAYSSTTQNASTFLGRVLYPLNYGSGGYCDTSASACGGPWMPLTFASSSDNIVSLRLSSQTSQGGPNVYADFDNLTFEATPPPVLPTPEATLCANFDSGSPSGMTLFGNATVNGGFLKLTDNQPGRVGIAYLNDFNGGQRVTSFYASFKAALFGSTCCGGGYFPADGFSFNLVPAATTPPTPDLSQAIEEGLTNGLTVSFDTWDNGGGEAPAIDVKWLGQIIASVPFQASQSPNGAPDAASASRDVFINLEDDGTIDVVYGGALVISNVPTPYQASVIGAPKWILGGRTGLATDNHWIDDLCITARAGVRVCKNFGNRVPETGVTLFGDAKMDAGILKLVSATDTNGFGIAYVDDFGGGEFVQGFQAFFTAALFGSTCCGGGLFPADGFSFNLVPANWAAPNPGYGQPAEEGSDDGLSITFDTWDNGDFEAPAVGIKWLGQFVTNVAFQASQSPVGATDFRSAARDVFIELKANGRVDVSYGGILLLSNVAIPYDPAAIGVPKWVLGARIGGANDNHWFDSLCITTLPAVGRPIPGLFNTGVNAAGTPLADNVRDPHYSMVAVATDAYAATSAGGSPIPPWLGDSTVSAWISPSLTTLAPSDGSGNFNYRYETTFDLTGFNIATARLAGRWASDNRGLDILINGTSTAQSSTSFDAWTRFQITNGFVPGTNRLTFIVNNGLPGAPQGSDPTGLRVELLGMASLDCAFARSSPRISIARQGGAVALGWGQPGFLLQTASSLRGPWVDATRGNSI
ncbi:MAG TPA: hypothetical protein VK615_11235, partial [Candidatus Binatia bacterium]|nr:hypothetical protein [Candidatus Binatia bacterium]